MRAERDVIVMCMLLPIEMEREDGKGRNRGYRLVDLWWTGNTKAKIIATGSRTKMCRGGITIAKKVTMVAKWPPLLLCSDFPLFFCSFLIFFLVIGLFA